MKPEKSKTRIFLDSGDPFETKEIIQSLGSLAGQTTNPTLVSRNPYAQKRFAAGEKFTAEEIFDFYKKIVTEISGLIPSGSVSIEVYADKNTTAEQMIKQAREFFRWIPNAHIKLPITAEGLKAAEQLTEEGVRLNLTLCFTQQQAAAVYAATRGAGKGDVFVSPFVGRLDDQGENGMDLIKNLIEMYAAGDGHVEIISASIRNFDHFLATLKLGADIATVPYKILKEWAAAGANIPGSDYIYPAGGFQPIPYENFDFLNKDWHSFDLRHNLTDAGMEKFSQDWNSLIG